MALRPSRLRAVTVNRYEASNQPSVSTAKSAGDSRHVAHSHPWQAWRRPLQDESAPVVRTVGCAYPAKRCEATPSSPGSVRAVPRQTGEPLHLFSTITALRAGWPSSQPWQGVAHRIKMKRNPQGGGIGEESGHGARPFRAWYWPDSPRRQSCAAATRQRGKSLRVPNRVSDRSPMRINRVSVAPMATGWSGLSRRLTFPRHAPVFSSRPVRQIAKSGIAVFTQFVPVDAGIAIAMWNMRRANSSIGAEPQILGRFAQLVI